MTQMTQNEYNPDLLENYLKQHPNASNKELYEICNATTDSQKGYIRKKKSRLSKKNDSKGSTDPGIKNLGPINILTSDVLEQLICKMLNEGATESKIRIAVDFYNKVKGKMETIDDDIDMEALREIGVNIKGSD